MKKTFVALMGLLLALPVASHLDLAVAAPATMPTIKAVKAKGATTKPKDAPKKPSAAALKGMKTMPAPASKGGKKTKAPTFITHIDNRTSGYVDVYIDRQFRGTVGPWGDGYYYVLSGGTVIYCEDEDGNYWSDTVNQSSGTYTVRLRP